ncbi:hypothetical protein EST38_g12358 [Candolleomyces aberdarensis]|uniref:Uncharacterized protein n=1 Tax=Candolleomyces aberdarensis TaxID=2316362 RepID=A0A4Q2D5P9_9AGAR|nr:hypothetical protein EST38_g12358 [Candolleomyces aberdarensis]
MNRKDVQVPGRIRMTFEGEAEKSLPDESYSQCRTGFLGSSLPKIDASPPPKGMRMGVDNDINKPWLQSTVPLTEAKDSLEESQVVVHGNNDPNPEPWIDSTVSSLGSNCAFQSAPLRPVTVCPVRNDTYKPTLLAAAPWAQDEQHGTDGSSKVYDPGYEPWIDSTVSAMGSGGALTSAHRRPVTVCPIDNEVFLPMLLASTSPAQDEQHGTCESSKVHDPDPEPWINSTVSAMDSDGALATVDNEVFLPTSHASASLAQDEQHGTYDSSKGEALFFRRILVHPSHPINLVHDPDPEPWVNSTISAMGSDGVLATVDNEVFLPTSLASASPAQDEQHGTCESSKVHDPDPEPWVNSTVSAMGSDGALASAHHRPVTICPVNNDIFLPMSLAPASQAQNGQHSTFKFGNDDDLDQKPWANSNVSSTVNEAVLQIVPPRSAIPHERQDEGDDPTHEPWLSSMRPEGVQPLPHLPAAVFPSDSNVYLPTVLPSVFGVQNNQRNSTEFGDGNVNAIHEPWVDSTVSSLGHKGIPQAVPPRSVIAPSVDTDVYLPAALASHFAMEVEDDNPHACGSQRSDGSNHESWVNSPVPLLGNEISEMVSPSTAVAAFVDHNVGLPVALPSEAAMEVDNGHLSACERRGGSDDRNYETLSSDNESDVDVVAFQLIPRDDGSPEVEVDTDNIVRHQELIPSLAEKKTPEPPYSLAEDLKSPFPMLDSPSASTSCPSPTPSCFTPQSSNLHRINSIIPRRALAPLYEQEPPEPYDCYVAISLFTYSDILYVTIKP